MKMRSAGLLPTFGVALIASVAGFVSGAIRAADFDEQSAGRGTGSRE